ncbi:SDR family NAD(P)-dependent oxidoreductase [Ralstonia pseudosolanacearum]|uniref:SDR family NAD(P)-dependent oxidoreductase n=1 Tax=Ralstonia pseudosolanacearum TaxID=1310165 RepID=UPI0008F8F370|nr:SDR family NAD(P)-dependent oxidoreductase [Ralstonia pseudosolanacearum]MCK4165330.1 SDR family NAD(P)-dependent oxidoreductase [Ralstonia pseudosolanacearum]OIN69020.1 hypothetical protein BL248_22280 [Ralstonia solanacearum]
MQDLKNKVFLVTGATDGIGKAAATEFAKRGATVTLVGRNKAKTEGVVAELKAATGNENLDYLLCDLSRIAEVKRMAEAFKASQLQREGLAYQLKSIEQVQQITEERLR